MPFPDLRPYQRGDFLFLCEMLHEAVYWQPEAKRLPIRLILRLPPMGYYIQGWGRDGDTALLAVDEDGKRVGAAWYRFFPSDAPGYGFLDETTPEISLAVAPEWRRQGIGEALLTGLIQMAQEQQVSALSLSVAKANPARFLYEKCGFTPVATDGDTMTMRLALPQACQYKAHSDTPSQETQIIVSAPRQVVQAE
jgi:ribosomal protein S18 acetylase RimI-like enzyme